MDFRITGLPMAEFAAILRLGDADLRAAGITRCVVDEPHAYPCRITLEDAMPGEEVLLLSLCAPARGNTLRFIGSDLHQAQMPLQRQSVTNAVPDQQRRRLLSVRAYDVDIGWSTPRWRLAPSWSP